MTEDQKKLAEVLIKRINERMKDDEDFEEAKYTWYGWNWIEVSGSLKQVPGYKFVECQVPFDLLRNVEQNADKFIEHWNEVTSPESIKGFAKFISDGEKWGCD